MQITVTCRRGPLNGKSFLVPSTQQTLYPPPALIGGRYKITGKIALWIEDTPIPHTRRARSASKSS